VSFVTVEGIEGSGKSTLLAGLESRLRSTGREIIVTREPGGTPAGDAIRRIFLEPALAIAPLTEALLINAARAQHVEEKIRPALRRRAIVLCDRFVDSTLAYQGYGRGMDIEVLRTLCDVATGGLLPGLTLVLDVPVEVSRSRIATRNASLDRMEAEEAAFHERVRSGFLELAKSSPRYRVIDASRDEDAVLADALAALSSAV
jgi:dTMP kinase